MRLTKNNLKEGLFVKLEPVTDKDKEYIKHVLRVYKDVKHDTVFRIMNNRNFVAASAIYDKNVTYINGTYKNNEGLLKTISLPIFLLVLKENPRKNKKTKYLFNHD